MLLFHGSKEPEIHEEGIKEEVRTILYDTKDTIKDATKKTMGKVHNITEAAGEKIEHARENVMEKAHEMKEKVIWFNWVYN